MKLYHSPNFVPRGDERDNSYTVGRYEKASPDKDSDTSFVWTNFEYPWQHKHTHWECQIIVSGSIWNHMDDKRTLLQTGDALFLRPNDMHYLKFDAYAQKQSFRSILILIRTHHVQNIVKQYGKDAYDKLLAAEDLGIKLPPPLLEYLINTAMSLQFTAEKQEIEFHSNIFLHAVLNELFMQKFSCDKKIPSWLIDFLNLLSNTKVIGMSLDDLVKKTSYTYSALSRIIKRITGKTIIEYINQTKMSYAHELLKNSEKTMLEICLSLGFGSLSHFNHLFKKTYGVTPTVVREQSQSNKNTDITR